MDNIFIKEKYNTDLQCDLGSILNNVCEMEALTWCHYHVNY
jgi:hypothetical protein